MIIYISTDSLFIFQLCTSTYSVHAGILKLWRGRLPRPLVVFSFHYGLSLPSSFVRSQLTLPVPTMRIRPPFPQNGAPIHRVRAHSLSRVRYNYYIQLVSFINSIIPIYTRTRVTIVPHGKSGIVPRSWLSGAGSWGSGKLGRVGQLGEGWGK